MTSRGLISVLLWVSMAAPCFATGPSGAQQKGAEGFLVAVASGDAQAVAQELDPDDLEGLRSKLLTLLHAENLQGNSTYKSRLFGSGRSLKDVEGMTAERFWVALSERLRMRARPFEKFEWLAAVPDGKMVYL